MSRRGRPARGGRDRLVARSLGLGRGHASEGSAVACDEGFRRVGFGSDARLQLGSRRVHVLGVAKNPDFGVGHPAGPQPHSEGAAPAYRMLGSLAEAEDAVQEAWLRLSRSGTGGIENLGDGWPRSSPGMPEHPAVAPVPARGAPGRARARPLVSLEDELNPVYSPRVSRRIASSSFRSGKGERHGKSPQSWAVVRLRRRVGGARSRHIRPAPQVIGVGPRGVVTTPPVRAKRINAREAGGGGAEKATEFNKR